MRGGLCATRRFYHAFYRWSVANTARPGCRALSTTSRRNAADDAVAPTANPRSATSGRAPGTGMRRLDLSAQPRQAGDGTANRYARLKHSPVLTSTEKPFDTFTEWDEAVRYRSEAGVLLQLAVPSDNVRHAQLQYGERLEKLQERSGARVEIGNASQHSGLDVVSVTLSGTFEEVNHFRSSLATHKLPYWMSQNPPSEVPSSSVPPWTPALRESEGSYRKIELVVPSHHAADLPRITNIPKLTKKFNVHIDFPETEIFEDRSVHSLPKRSIFISGSGIAVLKAWHALTATRQEVEARSGRHATKSDADARTESGVQARVTKYEYERSSKTFFLQLRLPRIENAERQPSHYVIGTKGARLHAISREFDIECSFDKDDFSLLTLIGSDENRLRQAKAQIQVAVDRACRREDSFPVPIEEVKFGQFSQEAAEDVPQTQHAATDISGPDAVKLDAAEHAQEASASGSYADVSIKYDIPSGPNGETEVRSIVLGPRRWNIERMKRQFGVKAKLLGSDILVLKIYGADEARVRQAGHFVQELLTKTCQRLNIPPMELRELQVSRRQPTSESSPTTAVSSVGSNSAANTAMRADDVTSEPSKVSPEDMKLGLGALTHPVVLVTSQIHNELQPASPEDLLPFCRGVTVSSFNSVALEPRPVISFNIRTPSRTWDAISSSGWLAAHVLISSPVGAALAHAFTLPYQHPEEPFWRARALGALIGIREPLNGAWQSSPTITLSDGVLCAMKAKVKLAKCVQVGDHMIVVAEVKRMFFPPHKDGTKGRDVALDAAGLTYAKRGYRGMGEQIELATIPEAAFESSTAPSAVETAAQMHATSEEGQAGEVEEDDADDRVGGAGLETQSREISDAQTPDQTEMDYFEAFEKDDDESSSVLEPGDTIPQEEELDLSAELAVDETSESQPLVEDSAAAQDEASDAPSESDAGEPKRLKQAKDDETTGTHKRAAVDSSVP